MAVETGEKPYAGEVYQNATTHRISTARNAEIARAIKAISLLTPPVTNQNRTRTKRLVPVPTIAPCAALRVYSMHATQANYGSVIDNNNRLIGTVDIRPTACRMRTTAGICPTL